VLCLLIKAAIHVEFAHILIVLGFFYPHHPCFYLPKNTVKRKIIHQPGGRPPTADERPENQQIID